MFLALLDFIITLSYANLETKIFCGKWRDFLLLDLFRAHCTNFSFANIKFARGGEFDFLGMVKSQDWINLALHVVKK